MYLHAGTVCSLVGLNGLYVELNVFVKVYNKAYLASIAINDFE